MIFSSLNNFDAYSNIDEKILRCIEFANYNNLKKFECGKYEIDKEDIFVNIVEYETSDVENRFWESHKKYIDLHLILLGSKCIKLNSINNLVYKDYVEESDFLSYEGESNCDIVLNNGEFLICFPEDVHMTGINVKEKSKIKKAIFKIII
ncbi:MAG: YhcH/YjgK/YiaL family protein [Peptostreptococcaceae bacterium]